MREIFTSGSVGGLVEQSLSLPGHARRPSRWFEMDGSTGRPRDPGRSSRPLTDWAIPVFTKCRREYLMHHLTGGEHPRPLAAHTVGKGFVLGNAQLHQIRSPRAARLPLLPDAHPEAAANPLVQVVEEALDGHQPFRVRYRSIEAKTRRATSPRLDQHEEVVRITHRAEPARSNSLSKSSSRRFANKGEKRTALDRAFERWLQFGVDHDARRRGTARSAPAPVGRWTPMMRMDIGVFVFPLRRPATAIAPANRRDAPFRNVARRSRRESAGRATAGRLRGWRELARRCRAPRSAPTR